QIDDRRIVEAEGEIEQHAVRAEIFHIFRIEILDRWKRTVSQQGNPVIISAYMHAPLLPGDRGRRFYRAMIEAALVIDSVLAAEIVHFSHLFLIASIGMA